MLRFPIGFMAAFGLVLVRIASARAMRRSGGARVPHPRSAAETGGRRRSRVRLALCAEAGSGLPFVLCLPPCELLHQRLHRIETLWSIRQPKYKGQA